VSVDKAKKFLKEKTGELVRSAPFQSVRDTAFDVAGLGLHEKLFLQSMTGGRRKDLTDLPKSSLPYLKGAFNDRELARKSVGKVAPWVEKEAALLGVNPEDFNKFASEMDSFAHGQAKEGDNLSLYGKGADLHLGLGNAQVIQDDLGNVLVTDKWDVDHTPEEDAAIARGENPRMSDLVEGGSLASRIYHFARRLGTYEPINVAVNIPSENWEGIEAQAPPKSYPTHSRTVNTVTRPPEQTDIPQMPPSGLIDGNLHDVWKQKNPVPNGFPSNSFLP